MSDTFTNQSAIVQEQALTEARQQFEREQTAARETLRSFAPGFGAGRLLADAMARRVGKVIHSFVYFVHSFHSIHTCSFPRVRCMQS